MSLIFKLLIGVLLLILIIGRIIYATKFRKEVDLVLGNYKNNSNKKFTYKQLEGLPAPVQRYFKNVLAENQPYINSVRLKHNGQFKIGVNKNWCDIQGQEYFTTEIPSFIWKGKIGVLSAKDMYLEGKGKIVVTLLHIFNIVKKEGGTFNQGELLRWLGESVWFPTNLLPNDRLKWHAIDDSTAKVTFTYNKLSLFYIVSFNEQNQIYKLETKRYFKKDTLKTWIGECYKYKELNGVKVPTVLKASWILNKSEHNYALFNVQEIEYDKQTQF